jgi:hypothetical protein
MKTQIALVVTLSVLAGWSIEHSPNSGFIASYKARWLGTGGSIAVGPDSNLWVTGKGTIAKITTSGSIVGHRANVDGGSIASGPNASVWFTPTTGGIGAMSTGGSVQYYSLPNGGTAGWITEGPDGNEWFIDSNGAIGKITPAGLVTEYTSNILGNPSSLTNWNGSLWFIDSGTSAGVITTNGQISEWSANNPCFTTGNIAVSTSGLLVPAVCQTERQFNAMCGISLNNFGCGNPVAKQVYVQAPLGKTEIYGGAGGLVRYDTFTGSQRYIGLPPIGPSRDKQYVNALVIGPDGNVWIVADNPGYILVYADPCRFGLAFC